MPDYHVQWPVPRERLSPSALKEFQQCPESFRRKYLLNQWDRSSWSGVTGTALHRAQEVNLKLKMITGQVVSMDEINDLYVTAFREEVEKEGGVEEIDWWQKGELVTPAKALETGRKVNELYHKLVAPTLKPIALEQWFTIRIPGVIPSIHGKIDLLELGGGKIDWKFGNTSVATPRKDWLLQADIYNLADETPFAWHSCSWAGKIQTPVNAPALLVPAPSPEKRRATEETVRTLVRGIAAMYHQFGPEEPWPGNGKTHTFACDYCSFHPSKGGNCVFWPRSFEEPEPIKIYTESTLI